MVRLNESFVVDKGGHKIGVFLDMKSYEKVLEKLEELDDIKAYDEAKASKEESISFEKAVREIERGNHK